MTDTEPTATERVAVSASWRRCEQEYQLARNLMQPILRLQSSEIAPRREALVERTGGRLGVFGQLAEVAVAAGHCFSIADADGILVRVNGKSAEQKDYEENGIALGSCWDERLAGTNGVSMAKALGKTFTVRGADHYFSKFAPFACTGAPLFDAENQLIGIANLASVDFNRPRDYLFAQNLLSVAAGRIQRLLFERRFGDEMLVSLTLPNSDGLLAVEELVAVDAAGWILGSTSQAHLLVGMDSPGDLNGASFDATFGVDAGSLEATPDRVLRAEADAASMVSLSLRLPKRVAHYGIGQRKSIAANSPAPKIPTPNRQPLAPALKELALGSTAMAASCASANACFQQALPFVVEGETGTGKSALIFALQRASGLADSDIVTVDCAMLGDDDADKAYIRAILEQARVVRIFHRPEHRGSALVLDNVDETPAFAQNALRGLLAEIERENDLGSRLTMTAALRFVATSRKPLINAVHDGRFREDLYYLLANSTVVLPSLRIRDHPELLAYRIAASLAGHEVEITPEALVAIASDAWPGNVRELRSALQQALFKGDGHRISLIDLEASRAHSAPIREHGRSEAVAPARHDAYDERTRLMDALIGAGWNVSQAARTLGIGRATIHRKIKRHRISRPV